MRTPGSSISTSMDANNSQPQSQPVNCKNGMCMFFGSAATEGYCSVCFKDVQKKREKANNNNNNSSSLPSSNQTNTTSHQPPPPSQTAITTTSSAIPSIASSQTSVKHNINDTPVQSDTTEITTQQHINLTPNNNNISQQQQQQLQQQQQPSSSSGSTAPIPISPPSSKRRNEDHNISASLMTPGTPESTGTPMSQSSPSKPKKRKCGVCKKKIGLTGFTCRCGGLYCPLHRYGDKHDCQYDYATEERNKLRKDNPVVQDEKIQKI